MENKRLEVPSMSYGTAIPELPLTIGAVHQSASRSNLPPILYHKTEVVKTMIKITIDDRKVQTLLKDLQGRLKDMSPVMKKVAGIMHDAVEENFEKEGRPKWKPSIRALKQGGKTLQDTGQLASSISSRYDRNSAQVGTNKAYAAVHQFGGGIPALTITPKNAKALKIPTAQGFIFRKKARLPARNIPARPFLKVTDGDMTDIKDALKTYLLEGGRIT